MSELFLDSDPKDPPSPLRRRLGGGLLLGLGALGAARVPVVMAQQAATAQPPFEVDTSPGRTESAQALQAMRDYIAAFNRGDFDSFGGYYTPDIDFRGRGGTFSGRAAVLDFYRGVRARVRETLTLRGLVVGQRQWIADVVTELHALEDWPDFPTGALRKGETRRSQNFIWYELEGGRFSRVRSARHRADSPPEEAATQIVTTDAAQPQFQPAEFAAYMDAFNNDAYASFGDHYAPDVVLVIAGKQELRGSQAIFDYYRTVKSQTRRTIQINRFVTTPGLFAAELQSEFLALEDLPNFIAGPMRKGGRIFINTFVIYELRGGKFWRIRSAEYRKEDRGVT